MTWLRPTFSTLSLIVITGCASSGVPACHLPYPRVGTTGDVTLTWERHQRWWVAQLGGRGWTIDALPVQPDAVVHGTGRVVDGTPYRQLHVRTETGESLLLHLELVGCN